MRTFALAYLVAVGTLTTAPATQAMPISSFVRTLMEPSVLNLAEPVKFARTKPPRAYAGQNPSQAARTQSKTSTKKK